MDEGTEPDSFNGLVSDGFEHPRCMSRLGYGMTIKTQVLDKRA